MNINKFTQKSAEALNNCEKLAYEYGNQEIDQEHLLYSLLTIEDSLIAKLVEKMEIHLPSFIERAKKALEQKTKVSGDVQLMISQSLNKVLVSAEDEAKKMGDEYVSVEHIFLTLIAYPNNAVKAIFKEYGITRDRFLTALQSVRGNQQVTSDNPEATYDTLKKYGVDDDIIETIISASTYSQQIMDQLFITDAETDTHSRHGSGLGKSLHHQKIFVFFKQWQGTLTAEAVSYTHLTLPTILRV